MRKKRSLFIAMTLCAGLLLFGCQQEVAEEVPMEEMLNPVSLSGLEPGHFYVKSGDSFYLLPMEYSNFDLRKPAQSADGNTNGMTSLLKNRLTGFIHKDMAIPTLYKNDQLIYVSDDPVSGFTWERFKDCGYSIGLSNLILSDSGKIKSSSQTACSAGSTMETALNTLELSEDTDITVDAINGTALSPQHLNDSGIITGMSKDAAANVDLYLGTQHTPISVLADTRYFQSFELYQTARYTLSTDGYAIVEVPPFFRSGYYLINHMGFMKFLNVDRGIDESGIRLDSPYYYEGKDGRTLTIYEWREENGITTSEDQLPMQENETVCDENHTERCCVSVDSTQTSMTVTVAYKYVDEESRISASQNGTFPKVYLVNPMGESVTLTKDEGSTYRTDNSDDLTYLATTIQGVAAGEWQLFYSNFDKIQKIVEVELDSGNATSYIHNRNTGSIRIYYEPSEQAHDFTITWEHTDRALADIRLTAPDGTIYSKSTTPGNIMADEYGRYMIKVPNMVRGEYQFDIKGEDLGRVWVNCDESVFFSPEETEASEESDAVMEGEHEKTTGEG